MNELCQELAGTGFNIYVVIVAACGLLLLGYLSLKAKNKLSYFSAILLLFYGGYSILTSPPLSAQSANDCSETTTNEDPSPNPDNAVLALNDGPFTVGNGGNNIILIPVLNNDSPGSSTFNMSTLDLNPSTPEIDDDFYYSDGIRSGYFTHYTQDGIVRFHTDLNLVVGDTISIPYTISTLDGKKAGPANILIEIVDWIAQGDVAEFCGTNDEQVIYPYFNDFHASGLNPATIDLNPALPGRQTTYNTPDGVSFTVDNSGMLIVSLPAGGLGVPGNVDHNLIVHYTIQANDSTVSNPAPITLLWTGECGST